MTPSQMSLVGARMNWVIRGSGPVPLQPDVVRRAVRDVDPDVATSSIRSLGELRQSALSSRRINVRAVELFSQLALALAALGVYAVTAFAAGARRREMAIRLAFGSSERALVSLMMRGELMPVAAGLAIGVALTLLAGPTLAGTLFATSPRDPFVFALVVALLGSVAALAGWAAAARASRLDPIELLKA
jgi:putative ABC transport system permease protein